tara:strand:+ start:1320 stop:1511 length:192 start_codon:yes stop_codon:yes gene_type:complete
MGMNTFNIDERREPYQLRLEAGLINEGIQLPLSKKRGKLKSTKTFEYRLTSSFLFLNLLNHSL